MQHLQGSVLEHGMRYSMGRARAKVGKCAARRAGCTGRAGSRVARAPPAAPTHPLFSRTPGKAVILVTRLPVSPLGFTAKFNVTVGRSATLTGRVLYYVLSSKSSLQQIVAPANRRSISSAAARCFGSPPTIDRPPCLQLRKQRQAASSCLFPPVKGG